MNEKTLKIGLFGFGCVGQGLYEVLQQTRGIKVEIIKIAIKDPSKARPIDRSLFTTNAKEVLEHPEIDVIVELIDDADAAFEIVSTALSLGKSVVSANKKMIAEHAETLCELQALYDVPLLYEGACCASIPIIRNLEEYYDNDLLTAVEGIFNGSTNYILSQVFDHGLDFDDALNQAQEKGYAESDPSLDLQGFDAKFKLCLVVLHAFGKIVNTEEVFHFGIDRLNAADINFAQQHNSRIKLIARCKKEGDRIVAYCLPQLVSEDSPFYRVDNEYNGIQLESAFSEKQFFTGKGAGDQPTGTAVLSDLSALTYDYRYEYKKRGQNGQGKLNNNEAVKLYVRYGSEGIDESGFQEIETRHESNLHNYLIGTIPLQDLKKAAWVERQDVNFLELAH